MCSLYRRTRPEFDPAIRQSNITEGPCLGDDKTALMALASFDLDRLRFLGPGAEGVSPMLAPKNEHELGPHD